MNFNVGDFVVVNGVDANGVMYQNEPAIVMVTHQNMCLVQFVSQNVGYVHPTLGQNTAEVNIQYLQNSDLNHFHGLLQNVMNLNEINNRVNNIFLNIANFNLLRNVRNVRIYNNRDNNVPNNNNGGSLKRKSKKKSSSRRSKFQSRKTGRKMTRY
jgi:hypothetical protein